MAFSNIVSNVLLFVTVIGVFVMLLVVYKGYVTTTNSALEKQQLQLMNKLNSAMRIENNATYAAGILKVYATNIGSVKLNPNMTDVYVDKTRVNRSSVNEVLLNATNIVNSELWDPKEILRLKVSITLSAGNHYLTLSNEYGSTAGAVFTV
jgi:archaellum component FlaF (FlaF/FlaG flagellin family)